ncbi:adenylyl-sulfate kinase [Lactiplantibacillus sp. WILCCON 0030]|uniref:Adenylyl-sulfate kinase n=1 Tax=Lactiplantibacillus brownii TaxID=3069269 RepID=A0ABU1A9I3_9LACO|nr:adenylyl-sulfate kinase [Lactiplantibacillus brownii]MDQ7937025.1 adenylyl-sulfate kinase [Lactiplantibacillus brownii]
MSKTKVIVISGVTAGGKTTLVTALSQCIDNVCVLSFDDYSIDALPSAPTVNQMVANFHEAVNQYDITALMTDLVLAMETNQFSVILIDFPFGYVHAVLRPYIETVIYLRTPLDIAFARRLIRDFSESSQNEIMTWTRTYLNEVRPLFLAHDQLVSATADYVLDGTASTAEQITQLKGFNVI